MIPVCRLADLLRGEAYRLEADPPVAVFHTEDGELYAVDDTCTRQGASLPDGWLEGSRDECPLHASKFDLRPGTPRTRRPVRIHDAPVEDGRRTRVRSVAVVGSPAGPSGSEAHRPSGRPPLSMEFLAQAVGEAGPALEAVSGELTAVIGGGFTSAQRAEGVT